MIWFTANVLFGEPKSLVKRPFRTVEDADQAIIEVWNSQVKDEDEVYVIGNFSKPPAGNYLRELKGKVFIVRGDMDRNLDGFAGHWFNYTIHIGPQYIFMSHWPHVTWPKESSRCWHLHGIDIGNIPQLATKLQMNVSLDTHLTCEDAAVCQDFKLYSYEEIAAEMGRRVARLDLANR